RLLADVGIVRHRGKIEAAINNARRACEMADRHGSLAAWFWRFEPEAGSPGAPRSLTVSPESVAMSKELKKLGWRFVGPTTAFGFTRALGLVNDCAVGCVTGDGVARARPGFERPAVAGAWPASHALSSARADPAHLRRGEGALSGTGEI